MHGATGLRKDWRTDFVQVASAARWFGGDGGPLLVRSVGNAARVDPVTDAADVRRAGEAELTGNTLQPGVAAHDRRVDNHPTGRRVADFLRQKKPPLSDSAHGAREDLVDRADKCSRAFRVRA